VTLITLRARPGVAGTLPGPRFPRAGQPSGRYGVSSTWTSPTASPGTSGSGSGTSAALRHGVFYSAFNLGVMSHGTFTPPRVAQDILTGAAQVIAW
jgi:hypothetical protein